MVRQTPKIVHAIGRARKANLARPGYAQSGDMGQWSVQKKRKTKALVIRSFYRRAKFSLPQRT